MAKHRSKFSEGKVIWLVLAGLLLLVLLIKLLLQGADVALFNPGGFIANEQHKLMLRSFILLLEIAIPTLTIFYFTAWKYRESNESADHEPHIRHGKSLVFSIWALPTITMLLLASVMWPATHRLAPQKSISNGIKPLTIKVVALRWKWLFIYPEQNIATVNFIQIPVGTPVEFDLTADETPMSSFWIPKLGGQLYAMTGHVNRLNLMADKPGDFAGSAAEINGAGFAGMKFIARASSIDDFNSWSQTLKQSLNTLNDSEYQNLLAPSESNSPAFYGDVKEGLYSAMLMKYAGTHQTHREHE